MLLAATASTALLIGPVSYHRLVFRQRRKHELVNAANRMAIGGLALLAAAMCGAVLLILDVVLRGALLGWLSATTALFFIMFWYVVPLIHWQRPDRQ